MEKLRVVLVGAGGYGELYARLLIQGDPLDRIEWVGVVDPFAAKSGEYANIRARGIPVYDTLQDFYAVSGADLTVISTPIPLHAEQTIYAMEQGSNVLLEKPIAGSTALAEEIIRARNRTGKKLFIGYQWCYDAAMQAFKRAVDAGTFGRPLRFKSLVLWPRDEGYYQRNRWAGKALVNGSPVYDSVSSNATAHYLFNMLYVAGEGYKGAEPISVFCVTGRANPIETFDTAGMLFALSNGAQALHLASHAAGPDALQEPMFVYEFENAVARFGGFGQQPGHITVRLASGEELDYGQSVLQGDHKLWRVVDALQDPSLPIICPAEAAMRHTRAIELARAACPEAQEFRHVRVERGYHTVDGLAERMQRAFEGFALPNLEDL